jgi:hypothetical protein
METFTWTGRPMVTAICNEMVKIAIHVLQEVPADAWGDCALWVDEACGAYPLSFLVCKSSGRNRFSENRRTLLFKRLCAGACG